METIYTEWIVYPIFSGKDLGPADYHGSLEECVRIVEARAIGRWAILPNH